MFSAFSGDWYPLHSDKEWAQKSPFGQRIAHGMLVLGSLIRVGHRVIVLSSSDVDNSQWVMYFPLQI